MITQHYLVAGRVQGVSFRAFVQKTAEQMRVVGKVRNLADGRVEVLAQGGAELLNEFQKHLLKGPRLARVDAIKAKKVAQADHFEGFLIEEDGNKPWFAE